jgi:short-subunit dehydrogenase
MALPGAAEETAVQESLEQLETNFFGVLSITNAVLPQMWQRGCGRIINIS